MKVDYLGAYQNLRHRGPAVAYLLTLPQSRPVNSEHPTPYQRSRRLTECEIEEAAARYLHGATVYDLAEKYGIHRKTVAELLRSRGVSLRYRRLTKEQLADAERLHAEGWSFVRLGNHFGVDQSTIWSALKRRRQSGAST